MANDARDRVDSALTWSVRSMVVAAAVCVVGLAVDERDVLGAPVWAKPLKFAVSIGIVVAGLRWLRRQLPHDRWVDGAAVTAAAALTVEQGLIAMQAWRGVRSHFNGATPFDTQVYGLMGMFVGAVFVAALVVAWRSFSHPPTDPVTRTVVSAGSMVTLLGMSVGVAMTMPLPNQELPADVVGAHSIGGADGGAGLPLVGWSTQHGDLRVAHFVGLHAFHLMVVVAAVLRRRGRSWQQTRRAVVATAASASVATVASAGQALAGRSVVSPSTWLVVAATAATAAIAVRFPRRPTPAPAPAPAPIGART